MNLTASLYHHHKIRACDSMLKALFLFCRENDEKLCGRRIETAADFLHLTDFKLLGGVDHETGPVREMLSNLVRRRLYKRALVFSMNTFEHPDTEESEESQEEKELNRVYELIELPFEGQRKLAEAIWEAAGGPAGKRRCGLTSRRARKPRT